MPRPRAATRSPDAVISNAEMARIFREIGDMLEILGEVVFKAVAYRRAADAIERYPEDVASRYAHGDPPQIPGVGSALRAKLAEMAETGRLAYYERLRDAVPLGLLEMLRISGVGPRTVKLLYDELRIDSVDALRVAAIDGRLRQLKGLSTRTEESILQGIARLDRTDRRLLLHDADLLVGDLLDRLRSTPGVIRIEAAGSVRRRCSTIGDLDILTATTNPSAIIARLDGLPEVERVLAAGGDKTSVVLADGPQVDLMVCAPEAWGTHLVHFTGSRDHNIALRGRALERGMSLSEQGWKVVDGGAMLHDATEEAVYDRLELPWIAPELRETGEEVTAAAEGRLPTLVEAGDLRGDTHVHSDWTDGVDSIEAMARTARSLGREWMVLTDHSPSLGVTRGLTADRVEAQRAELLRLNAELAPFRILHGTEMEIRADGTLDYPDALLATMDVVVASVHTGRGQSREQLTRRTLAAIDNPNVDIIAHPTGQIVNRRDPVALDWQRVFAAAARTGTLLEINGSPRLDLDDGLARAAATAGVRLSLASDAHRTEELGQLAYAVSVARRAWLSAEQVAGTRTADRLLELFR